MGIDPPTRPPSDRQVALALEAGDEWAATRRTTSLDALARVAQTDPVSPPTAAA